MNNKLDIFDRLWLWYVSSFIIYFMWIGLELAITGVKNPNVIDTIITFIFLIYQQLTTENIYIIIITKKVNMLFWSSDINLLMYLKPVIWNDKREFRIQWLKSGFLYKKSKYDESV